MGSHGDSFPNWPLILSQGTLSRFMNMAVICLMEYWFKEKLKNGCFAGSVSRRHCSKSQNLGTSRRGHSHSRYSVNDSYSLGCCYISRSAVFTISWGLSLPGPRRENRLNCTGFQNSSLPWAADDGWTTRIYQLACMNRPLLANREIL